MSAPRAESYHRAVRHEEETQKNVPNREKFAKGCATPNTTRRQP